MKSRTYDNWFDAFKGALQNLNGEERLAVYWVIFLITWLAFLAGLAV